MNKKILRKAAIANSIILVLLMSTIIPMVSCESITRQNIETNDDTLQTISASHADGYLTTPVLFFKFGSSLIIHLEEGGTIYINNFPVSGDKTITISKFYGFGIHTMYGIATRIFPTDPQILILRGSGKGITIEDAN
jgi:hypothetical protein